MDIEQNLNDKILNTIAQLNVALREEISKVFGPHTKKPKNNTIRGLKTIGILLRNISGLIEKVNPLDILHLRNIG